MIWMAISIVIFMIMWLSFMLRQHYALTLQDRLIIQEVKFRYFSLSGKRIETLNYPFTDSQLFALRFASDEELLDIVEATIKNNWTPKQIKENIKNWKADERRV